MCSIHAPQRGSLGCFASLCLAAHRTDATKASASLCLVGLSRPSASLEDVEIMRIINKIPYEGKANYDQFVERIMPILYDVKVAKRRALSPMIRRQLVERYEESNARVAQRFFNRDWLFKAESPSLDEPWEKVESVSLARVEQLIDELIAFL